MTNDNDDNQPIDPMAHAAEQLLYGDPATAAEHLRAAILPRGGAPVASGRYPPRARVLQGG